MSERVLVTGASGFIGRHTLRHLQARGFEVHAVARKNPTASFSAEWEDPASTDAAKPVRSVVWHAVDLLEGDGGPALIESLRPERMLHLAWEATPGLFWRSPANAEWLAASRRLLQAFLDAGGTRVVMTGSGSEYDWRSGRCTEATTPLRPTTPYSQSKDALRRHLEETCARGEAGDATSGASAAWARLFWQFGPGEAPGRLVPSVVASLLAGDDANCSSGVQSRDFLYVDDVGRALAMLLDSAVEGCVNVGAGKAVTVAELALAIGERFGRPEAVRLGAIESASDEPPLVEADVGRLHDEVGFEPRWSLEAGLDATIEWWRARSTQ